MITDDLPDAWKAQTKAYQQQYYRDQGAQTGRFKFHRYNTDKRMKDLNKILPDVQNILFSFDGYLVINNNKKAFKIRKGHRNRWFVDLVTDEGNTLKEGEQPFNSHKRAARHLRMLMLVLR